MGPISMDWIEKHGEHWAGGRIDINGPWAYPQDYALPIMHPEDFVRLGQSLQKLETKLHNLLSLDTKVELEIEELKGMI